MSFVVALTQVLGMKVSLSEFDSRPYVPENTQILCRKYWWVNYVAGPFVSVNPNSRKKFTNTL